MSIENRDEETQIYLETYYREKNHGEDVFLLFSYEDNYRRGFYRQLLGFLMWKAENSQQNKIESTLWYTILIIEIKM